MISYTSHTIGGVITGEILRGQEPLPWILVPVRAYAKVWDRHGKQVLIPVTERVAIQGAANGQALSDRLLQGTAVFAVGQAVPAGTVAADQEIRGIVTLADLFQIV